TLALKMPRKPAHHSFIKAIIEGQVKRVRNMCHAGALIARPDKFGWLPIHRAAANDQAEIIEILLKYDSPLEPTGTENWTPLHLACVCGSSVAVNSLLKHGANVNALSVNGHTPLHLAVTGGKESSIVALISAGANVRATDAKGNSPLDSARDFGSPQVVALLERAEG
ncbi:ankyrin repeat domain-containing protein, partial [Sulfuriferula multivorans]|uniref:ankyrin repeat domain-containing protein n=1 Tax=Sulfuriferula multivorans TaxID=1559896 RepID=UPI00105A73B1